MPVAIPNNSTPKGPPRPQTTTSRRGGRARSPVSNVVNPSRNLDDNPSNPPSSAAAAAAAAAKAYPYDKYNKYDYRRPPPYYDSRYEYDRRYPPPHRYDHEPPPRYPRYYDPHRYPPRGPARGPTRNPFRSPKPPGMVFGGATPIHLPKSPVTSKKVRQRAAASVFRGRPDDPPPPPDDDSPQKILLSLRTPSTSFEDKKKKTSPGILPKASESSLAKAASLDIAGSFNLFNQSFDSFGEAGFNVDSTLQADSFGLKTDSNVLLGTASAGGIGYSPVNSFGSSPRNMIVGGERAGSPTQILGGVYRSYSDGLKLAASFGNPDSPGFYAVLQTFRAAFAGCTFLLPGIREKDPKWRVMEPTPEDLAIARRRVESSICAFGGSVTVRQPSMGDVKKEYAEKLSSRYYENESRLSWEFEEKPPVEVASSTRTAELKVTPTPVKSEDATTTSSSIKAVKEEADGDDDLELCVEIKASTDGDATASVASNSSASRKIPKSPNAKMKYRCKLCGQPKQNHDCPYQQSLARSIGTQIYPAVNAFTADEPGKIAAPLAEMNNFFDLRKEHAESSPPRPTSDRSHHMISGMDHTVQVTPDSLRSNPRARRGKKRIYSQVNGPGDQGDLLFVDAMALEPEQFKAVSPSAVGSGEGAFSYPPLPLPYAQRKRLSDNLFTLSNDVPKLTDECAQVLREAREKDLWDLAVAELMTQVIVIIHCSDRDFRFEGLRQYLLTLGIAC